MLYKFKTRNGGDVIMTGPLGNQVLQAAGREPAAQGIFEPAAMPAAIAAIEAAIAADEAQRETAARQHAEALEAGTPEDPKAPRPPEVSLRQRAWPLVDMLRRAAQDGEPVVWGV